MATEEQLRQALLKAHRAGDYRAAQLFADNIKQGKFDKDATFLEKAADAAKRPLAGFARTGLMALEGAIEDVDAVTNFVGLDSLIDSGNDNEAIRWINKAQEGVEGWVDPAAGHFDKFLEGVGSFGAFATAMLISPGKKAREAFRGGKGLWNLVRGKADMDTLKQGLKGYAGVLGFAGATGAGQQAQMLEEARARGIEVSQDQEDAAMAMGTLIGFSELAPLERILRGASKSAAKEIKEKWLPRIKRAILSGGAEGVQEMSAQIMQNLTAKGLYNPEQPWVDGSVWDEFIVGGEVGAIADLLFTTMAHRRRTGAHSEAKAKNERWHRAQRRAQNEQQAKEFQPVEGATATPDRQLPYMPPEPADPNDPLSVAEARAQRVEDSFQDNLPIGGWAVTEVQTPEGNAAWRVINTNEHASRTEKYGPDLETREEALALAGMLSERAADRSIRNHAKLSVDQERTGNYNQQARHRLIDFGMRLLHPETNLYSADQVNHAAGTTADNRYLHEHLSVQEAVDVGVAPEQMTAVQRINLRRQEQGIPETQRFTVDEIRTELENNLGRLGDFQLAPVSQSERFWATKVDGQPVVVSRITKPTKGKRRLPVTGSGIVVKSRRKVVDDPDQAPSRVPFKSLKEAKNYAAYLNEKHQRGSLMRSDLHGDEEITTKDIKKLLKDKNIASGIRSKAVRNISRIVTGRNVDVSRMTAGEKSLLHHTLRSLPAFETPTILPVYGLRPYTPSHYELASKQLMETAVMPAIDQLRAEAGPITQRSYDRLVRDLAGDTSLEQATALRSKEVAEAELSEQENARQQGLVAEAVQEEFDRYNLSKWGRLHVIDLARQAKFDEQGEVVIGERLYQYKDGGKREMTAEGGYYHPLQSIFLHLEAIKNDKGYQQLAAQEGVTREMLDEKLVELAIDTFNHESTHMLRQADLFTENEWQMLVKLSKRNQIANDEAGRTYYQRATSLYKDEPLWKQEEEGVAEVIKDAINGTLPVGGPQKSLIQRVLDFLRSIAGIKSKGGYRDLNDLIKAIQSGEVGSRPQGVVRTNMLSERVAEAAAKEVEGTAKKSVKELARESESKQSKKDYLDEWLESRREELAEQIPKDVMNRLPSHAKTSDGAVLDSIKRAFKQGFDVTKVWYTGRKRYISKFKGARGVAVHVTQDPYFATSFAGVTYNPSQGVETPDTHSDKALRPEPDRGATLYPLFIRAGKVFDQRNPDHVRRLLVHYEENKDKFIASKAGFMTPENSGFYAQAFRKYLIDMGYSQAEANTLKQNNPEQYEYELLQFLRDETEVSSFIERAMQEAAVRLAGEVRSTNWQDIEPMVDVVRDMGYDSYLDYEFGYATEPTGMALYDNSDVHGIFAEYNPDAVEAGRTYGDDIMDSRREIDPAQAQQVVTRNESEASEAAKRGLVPKYSPAADPLAQYIARNPQAARTDGPYGSFMESRREPELDEEFERVLDEVVGKPVWGKHPMEIYGLAETSDYTPSKLKYHFQKFKQAALNRYARMEYLNWASPLIDNLADSNSIAALLHQDRAMGLTGAAIKYGVPVYHDGWVFVVNQEIAEDLAQRGDGKMLNIPGLDLSRVKGLVEINAPLHDNPFRDLTRVAKAYAVHVRAKQLTKEGKHVPINEQQREVILRQIEQFTDPETGENIIKRWWSEWQRYNESVIRLMFDAGILTEETADLWRDGAAYFPFYRVAEGATGEVYEQAQKIFGGMTGAVHLTRLKGGKEPVNMPLEEAMTLNLTAAIHMSLKNIAQQRVARDMVELGLGKTLKPFEKSDAPVVEFLVKGQRKRVAIYDPLVYHSLETLQGTDFVSTVRRTFGFPAKALRELITREPGFMAVNLLRDSMSSYITSGAKLTPLVSTFKGLFDGIQTLEAMGVVGGYDYSNDPEDLKKYWDRELQRAGHEKAGALDLVRRLWEGMGRMTTASDAATRNAVFDDVYARTGNFAEASFQAMEVINFGRHGASPVARSLAAVIPFLNARFQGVDVFARAFNGRYTANRDLNRKQIMASAMLRASMLLGSTLVYYLMVGDDEQYKIQPDFVKDNYWIFPTESGIPVTIPIPFEVGLMFKTIPEAVMAQLKSGEGLYDTRSGKEFRETLERGVYATLEVNPFSIQFLGPLAEALINHNTFTGRQVVPQYMVDNIEPGAQHEYYTGEIFKWLGKKTNTSPMRWQHAVEGYVGTMGVYAFQLIDHILRHPDLRGDNKAVMPELPWYEYPVIKRFTADPEGRGYVQDAYDLYREVTKVNNTFNRLKKDGRMDEAQAYIKTRQVLASMRGNIGNLKQLLDRFRKIRHLIAKSDLPAEEKQRRIKELDASLNQALMKAIPQLKEAADIPVFRPYIEGEE